MLWLTVVVALTVLWSGEMRLRKNENAEIHADKLELIDELNKVRMQSRPLYQSQSSPQFNSMMDHTEQPVLSRLSEQRNRRG